MFCLIFYITVPTVIRHRKARHGPGSRRSAPDSIRVLAAAWSALNAAVTQSVQEEGEQAVGLS
jgi:hypothetical protein